MLSAGDKGSVFWPGEVSILEIAELSMHRARILARISYASDGYIVINTHVQANPLCGTRGASYEDWMSSVKMDTPPQPILAADKSLVVPMVIRITDLHVDGIIWLCWTDQSPHFSLAFVSDPLVNVSVSSSFDCMAKVKQSLQEEIEQEIRKALLKTIPEAARSYR
ncbi:mitochondrial distribution and morphology protein 34 [Mitosporidium daphniae]|uniref:Mitochondrial distribution and morphology protein 34 n=1 Tax=Mitosporidium daphniae TaxID=1485682 RepID=A0A098VTT7_9MICR|nr:mitochondrial distribution and morphology protein 34 [Mitosporidium daphniae]KGG51141.1 mitochondrial distribution and morphology protein 34 [Mitosporidium daphniae]|eukprot:XP_013237568.1 mitochondrial distribution and morphology protein 34 [Mitosporidium daphniae]